MNITGKWVLRAGALLVVLGFVLPALTVSCSGMPGIGQTFTLAQITSEADQPLLYLVPIGALIAGALSLIPSHSYSQNTRIFYTQISCMVAGLLSMGFSYLSLSNQVHQTGGFEMSPEYGMFILLGGYLGAAVGFWLEWQKLQQNGFVSERIPKQPHSPPGDKTPFSQEQIAPIRSASLPYLDPIQGNFLLQPVLLKNDTFLIGRGSDNDLQLQDPKVSRQHCRLRSAQGAWFIQDQGSAHGTLVNDQIIRAQRLETGDKITIGETVFIFHIS